MNERGDATLLGIVALVALTGMMILCALELKHSFHLLERRSHLFLCVKETKGELNQYLKLMGRTNFVLKNIDLAKWIMVFIPGLQAVALNAEKTRDVIKKFQDLNLLLYFKKLNDLRVKDCPLDPRLYQTPFTLSPKGFKRDHFGRAKMRKTLWTYYFVSTPYALSMKVNTKDMEALTPQIKYETKESAVTSSFLSSLTY